ncbi:MAG: hypothetical protein KDA27_09500 [Candidatus Eisenbacteria bacterium]|uniref:Uncharacterized protein n=1 Tax=Eiseniibacteriota bacterium TaxID=2212470 RepID=A0A956NBC0_UNCEI|nr:hypothetical protein [Candidatus Eisenbacteria bacterium]
MSEETRHVPSLRSHHTWLVDRAASGRVSLRDRRSRSWATLGWPVFGGLLLCLVFGLRLALIPDDFYVDRDDGVITMSHARNLVDYGFVGVNPSGERVEGFSAPVQFAVYGILYRVLRLDYSAYAAAQTWVATFLLGALLAMLVSFRRPGARFAALVATSLVLASRTSFLEWHASGLENAITHLLFAVTLFVMVRSLSSHTMPYRFIPVVALAGLSRVDGVFHLAPLLVSFGILWTMGADTDTGPMAHWRSRFVSASLFGLGVLGLVLAVHAVRWVYFGDWVPNTGYAQGISVGTYLKLLIAFDPQYWSFVTGISHQILLVHGGYAFLVLFPALCWASARRTALLLFVLVLTTSLAPFVFGKASLDPVRTTTHAALASSIGVGLVVGGLVSTARSGWRRRGHAWFAVAAVVLCVGLLIVSYTSPTPLCCPADGFEQVRVALDRIAVEEEIPRACVATPDLGALTWHKDFNAVDLGRLGSPILARLRRGPLLPHYLFDEAAPDLIECHGAWLTKHYAHSFEDPLFLDRYEYVAESPLASVRSSSTSGPTDQITGGPNVAGADEPGPLPSGVSELEDVDEGSQLSAGIWIRKAIRRGSPSPERKLIDAMATDVSLSRLEDELAVCADEQRDPTYVARTAYRFLPELLERTDLATIDHVFETHGASGFDLALLRGRSDGRAYEAALVSILEEFIRERTQSHPTPVAEEPYRVYWTDTELIWVRDDARDTDLEGRFLVRLEADAGTSTKEFDFRQIGYRFGSHAAIFLPLPRVRIHEIEVGQSGGASDWSRIARRD